MEAFRGDLSSYRLALLVPALWQPPATGTLTLHRGQTRRQFTLEKGWVVNESSNAPHEHLAQVLCRMELLGAEEAARAFHEAREKGEPFGHFLLEPGLVPREPLRKALEQKAREAFFACYDWVAGELEFKPGPVEKSGVTLELSLGALHEEALSRLQEWQSFRRLFPSDNTSFRVVKRLDTRGAPADAAVLTACERGTRLGQLLGESREGPLDSARRLSLLVEGGVLFPVAEDEARAWATSPAIAELLGRARKELAAGDFELAASTANRVLEQSPVPEAGDLYREAEVHAALALYNRLVFLEGPLEFAPLPEALPPGLTVDDVYLYHHLQRAPLIRTSLETAAMGALAAYRSLRRLVEAQLVRSSPR